MSQSPTNPKATAERGEKIYNEKYRDKFEKKHLGLFVVIEIQTAKAYLGETAEQALEAAREEAPRRTFHLPKVGAAAAFRVSYSPNASLDWVFSPA
jgi:hypothetical protein